MPDWRLQRWRGFIRDLLIIDMMVEKGNDGKDYPVLAGQDQFDAF